jgi:uncharacterized protein YlxP (DUF503 family)
MSAGYVGILSVELLFPGSHSLKDKRQFLRAAKAQLQSRFGASVAEVDHHDTWQRSRLLACFASGELSALERLVDAATRFLYTQSFEVISIERRIVAPNDG